MKERTSSREEQFSNFFITFWQPCHAPWLMPQIECFCGFPSLKIGRCGGEIYYRHLHRSLFFFFFCGGGEEQRAHEGENRAEMMRRRVPDQIFFFFFF